MLCTMLVRILCFCRLALLTRSAPIIIGQRDNKCPPYLVIETRGTSVPQGGDPGFTNTLNTVSHQSTQGIIINTVYPASADQDYNPGTENIIANAKKRTAECPKTKIILAGMSQGATATTVAMQRIDLDSKLGKAVAAVLLFGNPMHRARKLSNVDARGGKSTAYDNGVYGAEAEGIPGDWDHSGKVMDLCRANDNICTGASTYSNYDHIIYGYDSEVQATAAGFLLKRLGRY